MIRKEIFVFIGVLLFAVSGYAIAQQMRSSPYMNPPMLDEAEVGPAPGGVPGPGVRGHGAGGPMGYGMMRPGPAEGGNWGHHHMEHGFGMMGPGMGWMGAMNGGLDEYMLDSPEIVGTMMSIRGEMMSLMGQVVLESGEDLTLERWQQLHRELLEKIGESLIKHGTALKKIAKSVSGN